MHHQLAHPEKQVRSDKAERRDHDR
jgi:hypothetical protein